MTNLLILGGTAEAVELAARIPQMYGDRVNVISSLAGRVEPSGPVVGEVRVGGFGGTAGLSGYLRERKIDIVIDATHPYASEISAHARLACEAVGVKRIMLTRPPWRKRPEDKWVEVPDVQALAEALPFLGRRVLMTLGAGGTLSYARASRPKGPKMWYLLRMITLPRVPLPLGEEGRDYEILLDRGPFTLEGERALIEHHRINVVASKKSGGAATEAKIIAARQAGIPVIMLSRPRAESGKRFKSVDEVLGWLQGEIS